MLNKISENKTINSLYEHLQYIEVIFEDEISYVITDKDKYLYIKCCDDLILNAKEGDLIP